MLVAAIVLIHQIFGQFESCFFIPCSAMIRSVKFLLITQNVNYYLDTRKVLCASYS